MSVARAYDAVAPDYDRLVGEDKVIRQRLWRTYMRCFQPGQHLLDVACGTGIDAIFLAQQGFWVTAVDVSSGMIAQLRHKAQCERVADQIQTHLLDIAHLDTLLPAQFDGLISAFAGLNTVADLSAFAAVAHSLLRPDGRMILHMLNGFTPWEWLALLAKGKWQQAQTLRQQKERWVQIAGVLVRHHLYRLDEVYDRIFAGHFHLQGKFGLGILRLPGNDRHRLAPFLDRIEDRVGTVEPGCRWGRFFVLELQKRL
jgi:ubiquinone/menaquinone biosynthesis C-methylase UbiE